MTRHSTYRGDKLSLITPPSELIKRPPPCGIKSLAEGVRLAPVLQGEICSRQFYPPSQFGC